jgi:hypothetical protein
VRKVVVYELLSLDGVAEDPDSFITGWDDVMQANLAAVNAQLRVSMPRRSKTGAHRRRSEGISRCRAEGVGFEPTRKLTPPSGFQDRRHRPLGEPSQLRSHTKQRRQESAGPSLVRKHERWVTASSSAPASHTSPSSAYQCPGHGRA